MSLEQLVIIGSGPAAWTAAIYAARAQLEPLVIEGEPEGIMLPGGQLMITTDVENFPGFPEGITGPELSARMKEQAERFHVRSMMEMVESVDLDTRPFVVRPRYSEPIQAKALIVATGSNAKWLGIPGEERLARSGGGVSACAVCDGAMPVYRDVPVAVIGGGDTASEEALYLTKFASKVYMLVRSDEMRASRIMQERVKDHPKIEILWNIRATEVLGDDFVTGLRTENTQTGDPATLDVKGVFVAIGHKPNTEFLGGQLALHSSGTIKVTPGLTNTSVPGVFAAGDVMDESGYRQAVVAAGTGCAAALEAERYLTGLRD